MTGKNPNPVALSNPEELLFRQVHPKALVLGQPAHGAFAGEPEVWSFKPKENENFTISVSRSTLTTAAAAHSHYTSLGRESAGVWAVSVSEVLANSLAAYWDPLHNDPAHSGVDYRSVVPTGSATKAPSKGEINRAITFAAKKLRDAAVVRGCQFAP